MTARPARPSRSAPNTANAGATRKRRTSANASAGNAETSLTGKNLGQAAFNLMARAIPGELVREMASAGAPLSRYGGISRASAAALSRGLKLLAEPPASAAPLKRAMTAGEIADRIGRARNTVAGWVDAGLLGPPVRSARGQRWGRAGFERARLVDYLLRHGVTYDELVDAAVHDRLPLLVLTRSLSSRATMTRDQATRQAGVPPELATSLTRAVGIPPGQAGDAIYTVKDVQALRLIGALQSVYSDSDILEMASVVSRAMHEIAEAALELFRRRFTRPFAEAGAGELEMMLRLATLVDLTVPTAGPVLELVLRRQLEITARSEALFNVDELGGVGDAQVELAVGFADIVGFTAASARMSALEVSRMAEQLLHCAEATFPEHRAVIVKSMGDAVMFTAPDALAACQAAADLISAAARAKLPPLRVGIAQGPMLRAYADYFGRTVNIASRLCDQAPGGAILLLQPTRPIPPATWRARRLVARETRTRRLKGVKGRVAVLRVEPQN